MNTTVIPVGNPAGEKFGGIALYWTRSPVHDVRVVIDGTVQDPLPAVDVDGPMVIFKIPDGLAASAILSLRVNHSGEQLAVLDVVRADSREAVKQLLLSTLREAIDRWLKCRVERAKALLQREPDIARAQLMFERHDRETNPTILGVMAGDTKRAAAVTEVTQTLLARLSRCWHDPDKARELAVDESSFMIAHQVMKCTVLDVAGAGDAFDLFGGGLLRQPCAPPNIQPPPAACDADSAALFMYAEFAYMAIEKGHDQWTKFLLPFVRMQAAYVARWNIVGLRKKFSDYGMAPPKAVLTRGEVNAIRDEYAKVGGDPEVLRMKMHENLRALSEDPMA